MNRLLTKTTDSGRSAVLVAVGIFCSRIAGLIRQRVFAHYFGLQADAADAFNAAFRIPNLLQNLFGEGALSASFIPVYATLLARGERRVADRLAGTVAGLLAVIVSAIVLAGVLATPLLIALIAPGFIGVKRDLTIQVVRILFPGAGLLVMSAWCLGVLNSHHRFLLSYIAPVLWNAAMIATLLWFGPGSDLPRLAVILAWGSVAGSILQLGIQVPFVLRTAPGLMEKGSRDEVNGYVRAIAINFVPVFISRGVIQISAYVDTLLASLLPTGAVTGIANAQLLYTLPVSLFGMSVSAAELPAMSGEVGADSSAAESLRARLQTGLRRIAFFVVPSAVAFLAFGDVIAAALFQTGRFTAEDAVYVWSILAASAIGLLAATLGRLYASTFYALRDTRTPLNYAIVHVALATVLGYIFAVPLPRWLDMPAASGAAGLRIASGLAACVEMVMLRETLRRRIGARGLARDFLIKLWSAAAAAAVTAWAVKLAVPPPGPVTGALLVLTPYGLVYGTLTVAMGVPEAAQAAKRLGRLGG